MFTVLLCHNRTVATRILLVSSGGADAADHHINVKFVYVMTPCVSHTGSELRILFLELIDQNKYTCKQKTDDMQY